MAGYCAVVCDAFVSLHDDIGFQTKYHELLSDFPMILSLQMVQKEGDTVRSDTVSIT